MRIVIDLQACQSESRFRGIGRYSMSLTKAIIRNSDNHQIWIVLSDRFPETIPSIRAEFDGLVPTEHIVTFSIPGAVAEQTPTNAWRTRASELLREYFLAGLNPDIVHVSSLFEGWDQDVVSSIGAIEQDMPMSATLYDIIPLIHQKTYLKNQEIKDFYYRKIHFLKNAKLIFSISDFTRQETIKTLGFNGDSIINISSAADVSFQSRNISLTEKQKLFDRYRIFKPFILCVPGGFDDRKNIIRLVTAFSLLPEAIRCEHQLVITGKIYEEPYKGIIRHLKNLGLKEDEVVLTDYVGDDDLIALYNLCKIFIFPSLYEGFGLPVLEAMSCGAIAIASNATSLPEIIGRKDALFDPENTDEITTVLYRALTNKDFRRNLGEYESKQAKKFSWDISARKAIAGFEKLCGISSNTPKGKYYDNQGNYRKLISAVAKINENIKPTKFDLVKTANSIAINNPNSETRQILVDISVLVHGDAKSGIQRVVRSVLLELLESPPDGYTVNPIYFDDNLYRYATCFTNEFLGKDRTSLYDDVIEISRDDIYIGLDLSAHLTEAIHNYLNRINILGIKIFFIVYDILLAQHPEWWPEGLSEIFLQWLKSISEVASGLICISRSVAVDVKKWLDSNPPNRAEPLPIGFFHLGADIENSAPTFGLPEKVSNIFNILHSGPSFLMVGTIEPRKGHEQVLSAFEILWNKGCNVNLVIVGKKGWLVDKLVDRISNHRMLDEHLFYLEGISDEYLDKIYNNSSAVIMASEGEGFGLPIIEAARHNIPLILRDLPVFIEIAGDNATYFTGTKPEALASVIVNWLEQEHLGAIPLSENIQYLSWSESVIQLKDVILNQNWFLTWKNDEHEF